MDKFIAQWVKPFYLKLLGGQFIYLQNEELDDFVLSINKSLLSINNDIIEQLLQARNWRDRLTGSWFAGLKRWDKYADLIGELLVESEVCYAGEGYCLALAAFADTKSIKYLTDYLDKYLPQPDKYYDQNRAMSALIWIDKVKGTNHSTNYLKANGLWELFVADKNEGWNLEFHSQHFEQVMLFCDRRFKHSDTGK